MEGNQPLVPQQPIQVHGKTYVPAILSGKTNSKLYRFSQKSFRFISKFLETMSLEAACGEIGISPETGRRYLARKEISSYIEEQLRVKAVAAGTDIQNHLAWLRSVRDGVEANDSQLRAARILAQMLKPAGGGIHINMTQNNSATSPYEKMAPEQLADAMRERLPVIDAIEIRPTGEARSGG